MEEKTEAIEAIEESKSIKTINSKETLEFSEETLIVQKMLNQIEINDNPLAENGLYNDETKNAIMKLQGTTLFEQNGVIDQNLMFRLNEIVENPVITEYNQNKTFAVLYSEHKNNK